MAKETEMELHQRLARVIDDYWRAQGYPDGADTYVVQMPVQIWSKRSGRESTRVEYGIRSATINGVPISKRAMRLSA